jgi:hypothetical protein
VEGAQLNWRNLDIAKTLVVVEIGLLSSYSLL